MDISKLKIAWKYLTGGMGGVTDYLLDLLNKALASIDPAKKEQIQGVLNLAQRVLSTLTSLSWLVPTKWMTAYNCTITAVGSVVNALKDLKVEASELDQIRESFEDAIEAWKSPDDATCEDCIPYDV